MMSVDTARSSTHRTAGCESLEIALRGVAAVHRCQHTIAARLQRVVEVLAHRRRCGHRRERLGAHVLGVRAGEPHPANALDRSDCCEQLGEHRAKTSLGVAGLASGQLQVTAVAVDVLAEERDLADTL